LDPATRLSNSRLPRSLNWLCCFAAITVWSQAVSADVQRVPAPKRSLASGLMPLDRMTSWHPGLNAVGGIPHRTNICATLDAATFGNGAVPATSAIQAAIDACPPGQVVALSAGTFLVNDHILINKGITLRGAGPQATLLVKSNGAIAGVDHGETDAQPIVIIGPERWPQVNNATSQNIVANGKHGSNTVTVARGQAFSPGQFVLVDANDYDAATWTDLPDRAGAPTDAKIWASDRVVFMRHKTPVEWVDDPFPESLSWFSRPGRPISEVKEIASVNGNTLTFSTPLHIDFPVAKASQVTAYTCEHVTYAGIEDLAVMRGSDGAIRLECAAYSWVKGVEISVWLGEGVAINNAFRIEVRDSYIHDAALSVPGGGAYALSFAKGSTESLVENNIIMNANKMMVARSSGAGSVVAYNYADNGLIQYNLDWQEVGLSGSHMAGGHAMLFEGNQSFNYDSDNTHGNAIYMTVFRNHLSGFRRDFPGLNNGRAAGLNYGSWWHSFVGNVLGVPDRMQGWTYQNNGLGTNPGDPFGGPPSIWKLGYQSGQWDQMADPKVLGTVIRQGNFDYVSNDVHWDGGTAQAIPDSLYLGAKPAFFGTRPWPWVDPLGTVKLHVLPARARYDAGTPFAQP
jgi:Pectate lyase superfamily protein